MCVYYYFRIMVVRTKRIRALGQETNRQETTKQTEHKAMKQTEQVILETLITPALFTEKRVQTTIMLRD